MFFWADTEMWYPYLSTKDLQKITFDEGQANQMFAMVSIPGLYVCVCECLAVFAQRVLVGRDECSRQERISVLNAYLESFCWNTYTKHTTGKWNIWQITWNFKKKNYKNDINIHMHSLLDTPTHTTVWNTKEQGIFSISQLLNVKN